MKTANSNQYVKNRTGDMSYCLYGFGRFTVAMAFAGLLILGVYLNTVDIERGDVERARLAKEVTWLKTRVANLEGYTAHLEAQIAGLEFFDVVFTGDQAEAMRWLYDAAVEAELDRIAKAGGIEGQGQ